MNNIYISHTYFQILYRYLEQEQALHYLTNEQGEQLLNLSEKNPLEKAPLTLFNHFLNSVNKAELSPHLYLDIAHKFELKHYGLVGYIASHASTLYEAAQYIEKYGRLMIESLPEASIHLEVKNKEAMITWPRWDAECTALNEINLFAIHRMIQQLAPSQTLKYLRIEIAHAPCAEIKHYQDLFQAEIVFNASKYAFVYAESSLSTLLSQPDDTLISLLSQQAEHWLLQQHQVKTPLKQRLESMITQQLEQGKPIPEIDELSANFHLSIRSFQRKLAEENIIYRQLVEQLRMRICIQLLKQNQLSFTEIALQLGYADQSSLGRAFKKNHAQTLKAFKNQIVTEAQHPI